MAEYILDFNELIELGAELKDLKKRMNTKVRNSQSILRQFNNVKSAAEKLSTGDINIPGENSFEICDKIIGSNELDGLKGQLHTRAINNLDLLYGDIGKQLVGSLRDMVREKKGIVLK